MAARTDTRRNALLTIAAVLGGVVALNTLLGIAIPFARTDLTQDRLYSTSPGVDRALAELDEPVRVDLYWTQEGSADQPQIRAALDAVRLPSWADFKKCLPTIGRSCGIGTFIGLCGMLMFLALDGHLLIIAGTISSFEAAPAGPSFFAGVDWARLASLGAWIFALGLQMALPLLAASASLPAPPLPRRTLVWSTRTGSSRSTTSSGVLRVFVMCVCTAWAPGPCGPPPAPPASVS